MTIMLPVNVNDNRVPILIIILTAVKIKATIDM